MSRLARVAGRFHAAASTYDQAAPIQRRIAQALADAIAEEALPEGARVLELGCGTGFLTGALLPRLEPELWIASDIAPAMLAQARAHLDYPALQFAQIDAAKPGLNPDFDLVCSSLTLQWMDDPAAVVRRWREPLRPGGVLGFSTLLAGSFGEWRRAVIAAGAPEPGPPLTTLDELRGWLGDAARIQVLDLVEHHDNGLAFLKAARLAGVDVAFSRALPAGTMRRAIKMFEANDAAVSYRAALVVVRT